MRRRHFLQLAAAAAGGALLEHASPASAAEISLHVAPVPDELAAGVVIHTDRRLPATVAVTNAAAVGVSGWISTDGPWEVIHVLLEKQPRAPWSHAEMEFPRLQPGRRYRLRIMNATASAIPVHLPGHRVELAHYSVVDTDLNLSV